MARRGREEADGSRRSRPPSPLKWTGRAADRVSGILWAQVGHLLLDQNQAPLVRTSLRTPPRSTASSASGLLE